MATSGTSSNRPSIVLVHGAFADASGWGKVIALLDARGYPVVAVQNPLTSFADDVATTRRLVEAQAGPVVLVGHSYGGAVITAAAAGSSKVKALVYIAAFAPDAGEVLGALLQRIPSEIGAAFVTDAGGFVSIDRSRFRELFANDVTPVEAFVGGATQKPIAGAIFATPVPDAAWKNLPSWYLVASEDRAIHPDLERFMARRIGARTSEVKASHVPYLSQPDTVARLIDEAAQAVSTREPAAAV